jgi:hypothetical protein
MSQDMSLTSMLMNLGLGSSTGKDYGTGYLKLPALPKDENHFAIWKLKVEAIIRGAGLMEVLKYEEEELYKKALEQLNIYRSEREDKKEETEKSKSLTQEQKDILANKGYKVYAALAETLVTADQMRILLNKTSVPEGNAYKLWKAIKDRYDIRTTDATKERLWEIFNGMKMENNDDFKTYKAKVEEAVANLYTVDEEVPETRIKAKLITGLSTRYSPFVGALYTQDYSAMKMVDLYKKINDFEESTVFKNSNLDLSEHVPSMAAYANEQRNSRSKGKYQKDDSNKQSNPNLNKEIAREKKLCFTCNKPGHRAYDCYANKNKKKCSYCKKIGHTDSECHNPRRNQKNADSIEDKKTTEYGHFFAPVIPQMDSNLINRHTWILDSGASKHLCTNKQLMKDLRQLTEVIQMKCANKQLVHLNEVGSTTILAMNAGKPIKVTLREVAYAPTFQCNIISVGKLIDAGAQVVFGEKGALVFAKDKKVVLTARKSGNLFIVSIKNSDGERAFNVTEANEIKVKSELWHCRLGHIGHQGLQSIIINQAVDGLDLSSVDMNETKTQVCGSCLKGKQHRHPFGSEWRDKVEQVMDRAHADLCGPVQPSRSGESYLSTVIEEKSRMIFGELIKTKDQAADGIMKWCNKAKTFTGQTLKEFHSDGGGEYRGRKLLKYFINEGTEVRSTLPSTPQHNGIAERANRTIFESARTMMAHCKLPKEFWGDAVLYGIHIRNRCLTTADKKKTPFELWTGMRANVGHIRVFGCDAYMHIKDSDRTKLDYKSVNCIMLGFSEYYNGYKLFNISTRKVCYSRDVVFTENSFQHAGIIRQQMEQNSRKPGSPISEPQEVKSDSDEKYTDLSEMGLLDGFANVENNVRNFVNAEKENNVEEAVDINSEQSQVEEISQEEKYNSDINENSNENMRDSNADSRDSDSTTVLPKEVRALMADRKHALFSEPRSNKRNARADPGIMITDTKQMEEFSHSVVECEPEYCLMTSYYDEPTSYQEAMETKEAKEWKGAAGKEYQSLIDNKTWVKCKLPAGRKPIGCKWVFKVKINKNGEIERYKARLVAKGYSQKEGIDYIETFAPVLKYKSLRILLSIAAIKDMEVKQMDVETAFLNAEIKEEVYMEQPEGFHDGNNDNVYRLLKTLYGTKQAPHEWNNTLNEFIISLRYVRCKSDTCTYIKTSKNGDPIIIAVFVDDIIIVYMKVDEQEWFDDKKAFMKMFKMKDLNDAEWILGIRITRDRLAQTIKLDHEIQINKSLKSFHMSECNPATSPTEVRKLTLQDCPTSKEEQDEMMKVPYKSLIGSLQYIALSTRPDIAYAVNQLSRYLSNPGQAHWQAGKRVLRYLKGTAKSSLVYKDYNGNRNTKIEIFCDADWAGDVDDRKSTTGIIIKLNGCVVIWLSKKQTTVALSTAEAEYIAIATALQELLWMNQYLTELSLKDAETPVLRSDNQAAIQIATNDTLHSRSKHIDIRYHFIRDVVRRGEVELIWISTKDQEADINTKGLDVTTYKRLRGRVVSN